MVPFPRSTEKGKRMMPTAKWQNCALDLVPLLSFPRLLCPLLFVFFLLQMLHFTRISLEEGSQIIVKFRYIWKAKKMIILWSVHSYGSYIFGVFQVITESRLANPVVHNCSSPFICCLSPTQHACVAITWMLSAVITFCNLILFNAVLLLQKVLLYSLELGSIWMNLKFSMSSPLLAVFWVNFSPAWSV